LNGERKIGGRHGAGCQGARTGVAHPGPLHRGKERRARGFHPRGTVPAVIAGWITTKVGRQPFTIYRLLPTADSYSPIAAPAVATSLLAFIIIYFVVFGASIVYLLRLMAAPPQAHEAEPPQLPLRAAGITPAPVVIEAQTRG
jgi:cytochrome bd ubiquinol oxidase subunit I